VSLGRPPPSVRTGGHHDSRTSTRSGRHTAYGRTADRSIIAASKSPWLARASSGVAPSTTWASGRARLRKRLGVKHETRACARHIVGDSAWRCRYRWQCCPACMQTRLRKARAADADPTNRRVGRAHRTTCAISKRHASIQVAVIGSAHGLAGLHASRYPSSRNRSGRKHRGHSHPAHRPLCIGALDSSQRAQPKRLPSTGRWGGCVHFLDQQPSALGGAMRMASQQRAPTPSYTNGKDTHTSTPKHGRPGTRIAKPNDYRMSPRSGTGDRVFQKTSMSPTHHSASDPRGKETGTQAKQRNQAPVAFWSRCPAHSDASARRAPICHHQQAASGGCIGPRQSYTPRFRGGGDRGGQASRRRAGTPAFSRGAARCRPATRMTCVVRIQPHWGRFAG